MALHKAGVCLCVCVLMCVSVRACVRSCLWLHLWVGMHLSGSLSTLVPMHLQCFLYLLDVYAAVFVALFGEQVQGFKVDPAH